MQRAVIVLCVVAAAAAAAVEESPVKPVEDTASEQTKAIQSSPQLTRIIRKGHSITRGRSFFETMGENIMSYFGYGAEEYDDYGESDYYYPSFDTTSLLGGGGGGGNSGSSYSFYNPYGNYHPARDDTFEEEEDYSWGDFAFDAAIIAVPMALVMAAMPSGLLTIPIVGRSMSNNLDETLQPYELPILHAVEKADFLSFTTRNCQEKVFCEIATIGRHKDASMMQKIAYLAANLTPDFYAKSYGMDKLFKASRDGHCQEYKCVPLMKSAEMQFTGTAMISKDKLKAQ